MQCFVTLEAWPLCQRGVLSRLGPVFDYATPHASSSNKGFSLRKDFIDCQRETEGTVSASDCGPVNEVVEDCNTLLHPLNKGNRPQAGFILQLYARLEQCAEDMAHSQLIDFANQRARLRRSLLGRRSGWTLEGLIAASCSCCFSESSLQMATQQVPL